MKTFALILALSSVNGMGVIDMKCDGEAKYKVEFEGMWTLKNHPIGYPGDGVPPDTGAAHFSPLTGATFPYGSEFFKAGGMASGGIEAIAESAAGG